VGSGGAAVPSRPLTVVACAGPGGGGHSRRSVGLVQFHASGDEPVGALSTSAPAGPRSSTVPGAVAAQLKLAHTSATRSCSRAGCGVSGAPISGGQLLGKEERRRPGRRGWVRALVSFAGTVAGVWGDAIAMAMLAWAAASTSRALARRLPCRAGWAAPRRKERVAVAPAVAARPIIDIPVVIVQVVRGRLGEAR
jgi:hypothetical protein